VLTLVFGSALAVVPLLMAIPAILTSFLLVGGLEQLTSVSFLIEYLVALIGLGVTIDYSLLVVTRWREEREQGLDNEAAMLAAGATAGRSVVLSGLTVAVGLLSLFVLPVPFLRSVGYGGMLIPLVALVAAITLLPVTLSAWGRPWIAIACIAPPRRSAAAGNVGGGSSCADVDSPAPPASS